MEERTMNRVMRRRIWAVGLAAALSAGAAAHAQSPAEKLLLERAHAQEAAGHMDLAAQSWQQVLLSDPNSQEALAGLARWAKMSGNSALAQKYIDRLRRVNPNNPEIAAIGSVVSNRTENQMLQQAANLAKEGHNQEALQIFHRVFGTHPPDNWAQAYYDTEAGIPAMRPDAANGLRRLMAKEPGDPQYAIDLGRVLTYDAKTRAEGERLLSRYEQDSQAQAALRQALEWDVQNPAAAGTIRDYLKEHPDPELAQELADSEERQAKANNGFARTPAEREAFDALAANRLSAAQDRFMALNAKEPDNPRVLAGLGFLRMKQSNFSGAVSYFEQAEQNGLHSSIVTQSLATSRFWLTMQQATDAMNGNRLDEAVRDFRAALEMRPGSTDALTGLAGAYMKMQEPAQAAPVYQELLRREPRSGPAWRGLFMAQAQAGDAAAALATVQRFPEAVSRDLASDPDYLRTLATAYIATGQEAAAQKTLEQAISLPLPGGSGTAKADALLQYASLLAQDKQYARAAVVYSNMIDADSGNVSAWQGLIAMEHQAGRDSDAITLVERMPPDVYESALGNVDFLSLLAAIYQGQNHPDVAENFLERAEQIDEQSGKALPIPLQLQMAAVDLGRNHADGAYRIYRSVLMQHPDALDAWKGLLAALHATGHDADALAQIQQIPPEVRRRLDADLSYQQTEAAIYAATGNAQAVLGLAARIQNRYAAERMAAPPDVAIQTAWLLLNTGDDRDLYRQLMVLGDRTDMTAEQRRQVQTIWASWAERRAARAAEAGNEHRALEILTAAAQAFPGNPAVSRALAAGYAQAGQPKDAVAIYKSLDSTNASAADYQSMMGAALAAREMKQAESWLHEGLAKFPNDPRVLSSAAGFETARGDHARAADYWKAALRAMPAVSPATELAHQLDQVDPTAAPRRRNDLASLLNPDGEANGQGSQSGVPLPGYNHPDSSDTDTSDADTRETRVASNETYGPDPYSMGTAPVQLSSTAASAEQDDGVADAVVPDAAAPMSLPATHRRRQQRETGAQTQQDPADHAVAGAATGVQQQANAAWPVVRPAGASPAADPNANSYAPLRFAKGPVTGIEPETQAEQATVAGEKPQEVVLDSSPVLTPNAADEAMKRARKELEAASRPLDPGLAPAQYDAAASDIPQQAQVRPQVEYQRPPVVLGNTDAEQAQPSTAGPGASDPQLMQENLPPLRGPYERTPTVRQVNPRDEAQRQLETIEGGYSPWLGGTGLVNHRSGTAGFDSLTALDAPFESSGILGTAARLTVIGDPVFLDSGTATTAPILPGGTVEQLGTAAQNATLAQQNAYGISGEVQLAAKNFAVGVGYSPYGFLVSNVIGALHWKPDNGAFVINFTRDSVKDSQLAWAGIRDPGSAGPGYAGNVWGGVVSTGGEVQFGRGDASSGYYVSTGGESITGVHVEDNSRIDGDMGAYWRVREVPDQGQLTLGVNFFGMHYAHNLTYFTYGQGGYFSPQAYFLANIPVTWQGNYGTKIHYSIIGAFGLQAFQEDSSEYYPLDSLLQTANNNPSYPEQTTVGGNYDLQSQMAYHLTDHWFVGGLLNMNNTRSYNNQQIGFFVRFLFRPQVSAEQGPTGLFPAQGLRPFTAP